MRENIKSAKFEEGCNCCVTSGFDFHRLRQGAAAQQTQNTRAKIAVDGKVLRCVERESANQGRGKGGGDWEGGKKDSQRGSISYLTFIWQRMCGIWGTAILIYTSAPEVLSSLTNVSLHG